MGGIKRDISSHNYISFLWLKTHYVPEKDPSPTYHCQQPTSGCISLTPFHGSECTFLETHTRQFLTKHISALKTEVACSFQMLVSTSKIMPQPRKPHIEKFKCHVLLFETLPYHLLSITITCTCMQP
jgi:hypothetical protein